MTKNRYVGDYPVIGIRPCIDGRRGPLMLRESLEPTVWAMANAAKKLFEENLFYSNGEPVKVVLADTCIGRVPEAAACAAKFKREGVSITLSVTSAGPLKMLPPCTTRCPIALISSNDLITPIFSSVKADITASTASK